MDAFLKARPEASRRRAGRSASGLMVSHADKDDQYRSNARVVFLNTRLEAQLRHLNRHTQAIASWRPAYVHLPTTDRANGAFVSWDHGKAHASERSKFPIHAFVVSPRWIEQQLSRHGLPAPANFHRLFVRTALSQRNCPQQAIDAFMGHANRGELPHIRHGSFDYSEFHRLIEDHIDAICDEIGLVALPSALTRAYDQA